MVNYDDTSGESPEYAAFIEKFKPKKTTDDCYTPDVVYETVKNWAEKEYALEGREVIRPFWPGADYQTIDYPDGCVVIDNPPFSILSCICAWYEARGIAYFLFAPSLSLFSTNSGRSKYVVAGVDIIYANGAVVETSFITNLSPYKIHVCPELRQRLTDACDSIKTTKQQAKYTYPDCVVSGALLGRLSRYGQTLKFKAEDVAFIRALDSQRKQKKALYGGGFLLSERAAAERAAATRWALSERETDLQKTLK